MFGVDWHASTVAHGGRVHWRGGVRGGSVCASPRVCELWCIVMIDIVEAHAAIGAVLVFHYHRHGGYRSRVANRTRAGGFKLTIGSNLSIVSPDESVTDH